MTAPQPSRKARVMTFRFVPGGPDPMTNGFGSFRPSTVVASVGIAFPLLGESFCLQVSPEKFDRIFQRYWLHCFEIRACGFDGDLYILSSRFDRVWPVCMLTVCRSMP